MTRPAVVALAALISVACTNSKKNADAEPQASASTAPREAPPPATETAPPTAAQQAPAAPAGSPPPDGKYERVVVNGVTVPMINVMDNGATILVDTDGKKPRTWEEQYKRKRSSLLVGQYDLHKTNTNKNDTFADDEIDKEGLWVIDAKGNITQH